MKNDSVERKYVYKLTFVAIIGGFLFGYDTAVISGAVDAIREFFVIPFGSDDAGVNSLTGFVVSSALIGCIAGALIAGYVSISLGRKRGLMVSALLFLLSGFGAAFPERVFIPGTDPVVSFIFYRIVGGIGIGLASMISPMYIAEIAPASIRGRLVSWNQFAIVTGILVVYFVNWFIAHTGDEQWNLTTGWRYMFLSGTVPSLIFLTVLFLIPETPRFLVLKDKPDKALAVLRKTVGTGEAEKSLEEISETLNEKKAPWLSFGGAIIIISVLLAAFQQLTGINVVLYYAPEIFRNTGTRFDISMLQTILVGVVNMVFTIIAIFTVDRFGRKPLLITGGLIMGFAMTAIGSAFYYGSMGYAALIFILIYIAGFAMSWGPVMWVLLSEIFPNSIRGAMSIATATVWITDLIITWSFPVLDNNTWLVSRFDHGFAFWLYASVCFVAALFVWKFVPETKGRSLEDIEKIWKKR